MQLSPQKDTNIKTGWWQNTSGKKCDWPSEKWQERTGVPVLCGTVQVLEVGACKTLLEPNSLPAGGGNAGYSFDPQVWPTNGWEDSGGCIIALSPLLCLDFKYIIVTVAGFGPLKWQFRFCLNYLTIMAFQVAISFNSSSQKYWNIQNVPASHYLVIPLCLVGP